MPGYEAINIQSLKVIIKYKNKHEMKCAAIPKPDRQLLKVLHG